MSAADVMKELILAKYNESPVDRYPQEGPLTDHILAGLKAAGYAVIELPKPQQDSPASWLDGSVTATRGLGRVRLYLDDHRLTADNAQEIAAALLAAADVADVAS